jgi:hypothetical protein
MPIDAANAWVFRRLLYGESANGEIETMPEPFKGMAKHLEAQPSSSRIPAWMAMMTARTDSTQLIDALGAVDPSGPQPARNEVIPLRSIKMCAASEIEPLPVEWLWEPRLPLGMLSLFAGDPKLGKSFVTTALAAAVSRGAPLPLDGRYPQPASVIIMSAEDDPARTIVPRLMAAGADRTKVHILEAVILENGSEALPRLRSDIEKIGEAVASLGDCRLVILDPVSAYLAGVDDHKNAELRGVLSPLKQLAERLNFAAVLVSHLNKGASIDGKHRVIGSIAYVGACRSNFLFVRDREDPSGRRVLMLDNGCNLAATVPTLAYRIEDRGEGPCVEWESAAVAIETEDALRAQLEDREDQTELRECDRWLRETLAGGPIAANDIFQNGRKMGFSQNQLKGAKRRIGAETKREGFGPESQCTWRLKSTACTHHDWTMNGT